MTNNQHQLKNYIKQVRGISYKPHQILDEPKEGYIPLLRATNIINDELDLDNVLYVEESLVKDEQLLREGDILIAASSGSLSAIGKSASFNNSGKFTFGAFCKVIRPKNVNPNYLELYFKTSVFRQTIQNQINGANIKNIKNEHLDNLTILVPNSNLQTQVVNLLNAVKNLINKRQSQIAALDELTQSLFLEMFGDPSSKLTKFERKTLNEFGQIITGNTPSRKVSEYYGDYIEWIKSDNINTPYHFLTEAEEYLSEIGSRKGRIVPKNSILVTCIAGSKSCIGNAAIADREVAFNQQINAIVPKGNPYFLYVQFLVGKSLVQTASTDGMKGLVSKGAFQQIEFICPPIDLQNQFGDKFLVIQNYKEKLLKSLGEIESLYIALLSKAFKGELFQNNNYLAKEMSIC